MIKKTFQLKLINITIKNSNYQKQMYFESLKYQVELVDNQIICKPTFLKNIVSGGSFWVMDYFTIETLNKDTIVRIKLSNRNLILAFVAYLIAMVSFTMAEKIPIVGIFGFFGVLILLVSVLIITSISEVKKEVINLANIA